MNAAWSLEPAPLDRVKDLAIMGDVIDRDGFRANVGIILMQDEGQLFINAFHGIWRSYEYIWNRPTASKAFL